MNDSNHVDVIPRIVDNNMKITKEQLKNDKKKNESYINKKASENTQLPAHPRYTNVPQSSIAPQPSNMGIYILVIVIIVLIVIIVFITYLYYKNKNANKVYPNSIHTNRLNNTDILDDSSKKEFEQYIQHDDDIETLSMKSNNSFKVNKSATETNSIPSNMDLNNIEEVSENSENNEDNDDSIDIDIDDYTNTEDKTEEVESNSSIIDKLHEDLKK